MSDTPKITSEPSGPDDKGAVESQVDRIEGIKGDEVLGKAGSARGEHSGQNPPEEPLNPADALADNRPDQLATPEKKR